MVSSIIPFIIAILSLVLFIIIQSKNERIAYGLLLILLLFIYSNINESQGGFYALGLLVALVFMPVLKTKVNATSINIFGKKFKGFFAQGIFVIGGIGILFVMKALQAGSPQGAAIIGVPTLAISQQTISYLLSPAIITLIGVMENITFITFFLLQVIALQILFSLPLLKNIPFIGSLLSTKYGPIISSIILTATEFALFHSKTYSLAAGAMIFAGIVWIIWNVVYIFTNDTTAQDVSHGGHNLGVAAGRSLNIL